MGKRGKGAGSRGCCGVVCYGVGRILREKARYTEEAVLSLVCVEVAASSFDQGSRFEKMKHNRRESEGVVVFRIVISSTFPWLVEE